MFENTSENSELHDEDQEVTSPSKTLSRSTGMFILVVFTLAALVGNCIICYLVHSKYHLKTIPNRLVLNLCWCGTFTALLNGPLMLLTTAKQDWILGKRNNQKWIQKLVKQNAKNLSRCIRWPSFSGFNFQVL